MNNHKGGKGTGENVSSFNFGNFQLSAGAAGESSGFYGITGGGGGGILVDGKGPETSAMLDITAGRGKIDIILDLRRIDFLFF